MAAAERTRPAVVNNAAAGRRGLIRSAAVPGGDAVSAGGVEWRPAALQGGSSHTAVLQVCRVAPQPNTSDLELGLREKNGELGKVGRILVYYPITYTTI